MIYVQNKFYLHKCNHAFIPQTLYLCLELDVFKTTNFESLKFVILYILNIGNYTNAFLEKYRVHTVMKIMGKSWNSENTLKRLPKSLHFILLYVGLMKSIM